MTILKNGAEIRAEMDRMLRRYEPIDDLETVEHEMNRHDGVVMVRLRPFRKRFWSSYKGFRSAGMSRIYALRGAWFMART
jgi:hypothetical protein